MDMPKATTVVRARPHPPAQARSVARHEANAFKTKRKGK